MSITPQTLVRLISNVPFFNTYNHTMKFDDEAAQSSYFTGKALQSFSDFTYQRDIGAIKVPGAYDDLYSCNYLMFQNAAYSNKWFYAFITRKEYINPNTTRIYYELDVFQTWQFEMQFNPSFVVREHAARWNVDGTPVINTVDEGLNYGTEYENVFVEQYKPYGDIYFLVIISKQRMDNDVTMNMEYYPTINAIPQPLCYYLHPFKLDGSTPDIMVGGDGAGLSPIMEILLAAAKSEDAINNIVSMYITDYAGIPMTYSGGFWNMSRDNVTITYLDNGSGGTVTTLNAFHLPSYEAQTVTFENIYEDYEPVTESKLLMHPYTATILSDMKGNQIEIKNEYLTDAKLEIAVQGSLGTGNKVAYTVTNYLRDSDITGQLSKILGLETSIINNNPNDIPILSDYLAAFLQGNRNSMQNQVNQTFVSGILGTVGAATGGLANAGNVIGAGANAYFSMASINAKVKDISNIPPTLSQMGQNTYFDYGNGVTGVFIIKKQITAEYRTKLTNFFKMYGYKINDLKTPNLHTREHFNYIQTIAANITGNIPNDDLNKLISIFDSGITLWHGDYVADYTKVNNEL
jgi:hypothetical protein